MDSHFPSTPLTRLLGSVGPIHALTYSASPGTYILTGSADRNIRLYNPFPRIETGRGVVGAGKLVQEYKGHGYEVLDLGVSSYVFCLHLRSGVYPEIWERKQIQAQK